MTEWTRLSNRNIYLILDDLDEASPDVISSVGTLIDWIERSKESDRVKVLLTCRGTTRDRIRDHIFQRIRPSTLGEVKLDRLHAPAIEMLLSELFASAGFTCAHSIVRRASWLSSGHPGYCHALVDAMVHAKPRGASVTTQRFEIAVKKILRTGFGAHVQSRWERLSPRLGPWSSTAPCVTRVWISRASQQAEL